MAMVKKIQGGFVAKINQRWDSDSLQSLEQKKGIVSTLAKLFLP